MCSLVAVAIASDDVALRGSPKHHESAQSQLDESASASSGRSEFHAAKRRKLATKDSDDHGGHTEYAGGHRVGKRKDGPPGQKTASGEPKRFKMTDAQTASKSPPRTSKRRKTQAAHDPEESSRVRRDTDVRGEGSEKVEDGDALPVIEILPVLHRIEVLRAFDAELTGKYGPGQYFHVSGT